MLDMLGPIWDAFYLFMPAYFANMAPVIFRKVRFMDAPMDLGKKWNGKPIFGSHKTFRGLFFGILLAMIIAYVQFRFPLGSPLLDYSLWPAIGILMGFGAILGDSVESFFKRRVGIKPGKPWVPFDQIDFTLGALIMISFLEFPGWKVAAASIVLSFILHVTVNHIGAFLKIRKNPW
jgi:CDP-2,3-bis-(O-geranylgeranyl)-sn-glycerol synthase